MTSEQWHLIGFTLRMALAEHAVGPSVWPGAALGPGPAGMAWQNAGRNAGNLAAGVASPVVTGLVLLKVLGRRGPIGHWLYERLGVEIVFTWRAVVIALAVMSLPLLVRAARGAFEEVNPMLENMARTLGAGEWRVFFTISLAPARSGVVGVCCLTSRAGLGRVWGYHHGGRQYPGPNDDAFGGHLSKYPGGG